MCFWNKIIIFSDYEKKKRRYILVLLLLFQNFFGATFTLLTVNNILRYISAAVLAGIIAISSFLVCHFDSPNV